MVASIFSTQQISFSGWTPENLGAKAVLWWDAEDASSITESSGSVSSWVDRISSQDLTQGVGVNQPTYSATSFKGRPGITFDGTNDYLSAASVEAPTGADSCEIWALVSQDADGSSDTTGRVLFSYGSDSSANSQRRLLRVVNATVDNARATFGTGASLVICNNLTEDFSGACLIRAIGEANNNILYVNNVGGGVNLGTLNTGSSQTTIGATSSTSPANFWDGVVNSIVVTQRLTQSEANQLAAFLSIRGSI